MKKKAFLQVFKVFVFFCLKIKNLENKCFRRIELVPVLKGKSISLFDYSVCSRFSGMESKWDLFKT